MMTPKQAAEILGVSPALIRMYCQHRVFPGAYKKRGTRWVIPERDVMYVKSGGGASGAFRKKD